MKKPTKPMTPGCAFATIGLALIALSGCILSGLFIASCAGCSRPPRLQWAPDLVNHHFDIRSRCVRCNCMADTGEFVWPEPLEPNGAFYCSKCQDKGAIPITRLK